MIRYLDFNDCFLAAECESFCLALCFPVRAFAVVLNVCCRGSPIRQPWRHPRSCRSSRAAGSILDGPRHSREHDQGARDSRRPCPLELVQPRRSRPRRARQSSQHCRRVKAAVRVSFAFAFALAWLTFHRSGLSHAQTIDAVSQAFVDGQSLRTYRHAPNTGPRKSWAAGDACSRAVNLALLVKKGELGLPSVLTAKTWGFYDVLFKVRRSPGVWTISF